MCVYVVRLCVDTFVYIFACPATPNTILAIQVVLTQRDWCLFHSPRAAVNFNDPFAGGNKVIGNLMFNQVRETVDHGMYHVSVSAMLARVSALSGSISLYEIRRVPMLSHCSH